VIDEGRDAVEHARDAGGLLARRHDHHDAGALEHRIGV
jgi:hypothetical protein